jgi:hypothetical protein
VLIEVELVWLSNLAIARGLSAGGYNPQEPSHIARGTPGVAQGCVLPAPRLDRLVVAESPGEPRRQMRRRLDCCVPEQFRQQLARARHG